MAAPLLLPFASLVPVLKVVALGSVKFIGIGIGAAVAPVATANFLVGLSAGTPLKYAKFCHQKGRFSDEEMDVIARANVLVESSIKDSDMHLSRDEAREFLKQILITTLAGMKQSIRSIPARLARLFGIIKAFCKRAFSSRG